MNFAKVPKRRELGGGLKPSPSPSQLRSFFFSAESAQKARADDVF